MDFSLARFRSRSRSQAKVQAYILCLQQQAERRINRLIDVLCVQAWR